MWGVLEARGPALRFTILSLSPFVVSSSSASVRVVQGLGRQRERLGVRHVVV